MKSFFLQEGVFRGLLALINVQFHFIRINAETARMVKGCDMLVIIIIIIIKCVSQSNSRLVFSQVTSILDNNSRDSYYFIIE